MTSYNRALERTRCESIKTTLRRRILLWAGAVIQKSARPLPKLIMFGNLEGTVWRGRGGEGGKWTDCVQSDVRAFGVVGDWEATALEAEVWVEAVTEDGRRFMAARRKKEADAVRHRQEKGGNETGKVVILHGSSELRRAEGINPARARDGPRPA